MVGISFPRRHGTINVVVLLCKVLLCDSFFVIIYFCLWHNNLYGVLFWLRLLPLKTTTDNNNLIIVDLFLNIGTSTTIVL